MKFYVYIARCSARFRKSCALMVENVKVDNRLGIKIYILIYGNDSFDRIQVLI